MVRVLVSSQRGEVDMAASVRLTTVRTLAVAFLADLMPAEAAHLGTRE